jgi:hypothetical protein
MASDAQRQHLRALMRYTLGHERQIHYAQIRPMRTVHLSEHDMRHRLDSGGALTMDCSEGVTCLCKWAGLHDPNGHGYDGTGYTGTLLAHLPHYSDPSKARTGALVVFGPGAGDHVCMVLEPGRDPLLWSHGQERGPIAIRFSAEKAWQRRPATFLRIGEL